MASKRLKCPSNVAEAEAFLKLHNSKKSRTENARDHKVPASTYIYWHNKAEQLMEGYDLPVGHEVTGVSQLLDNDGNIKIQWVKTNKARDDARQAMLAFVEGLKSEIPRAEPVERPTYVFEEMLSCYIITDYHFGQMSWSDETGEEWDCEIAEDLLVKWFDAAITTAPRSHTAILANLGDFFHANGYKPTTPASGHMLDVSDRFPKAFEMGVRVLKRIIHKLLQHHEEVHIIMAEGNHDEDPSVALRIMFDIYFEDEPRVTVDKTQDLYYLYEWGKTALYFHHGHKAKIKDLPPIFVSKDKELYGRTDYHYAHCGHMHHQELKEGHLMIVEQHDTLAPKDAYATRGGYSSKRGAKVLTYSKIAGEVYRTTIRPEVLK